VALYFSVFVEGVMQKADRSFSLRASWFQIRKKQRYSVDGLMMFSCKGIQGMDLREISVLNFGGDHRLIYVYVGAARADSRRSGVGLAPRPQALPMPAAALFYLKNKIAPPW
jgi:hypothetical protein